MEQAVTAAKDTHTVLAQALIDGSLGRRCTRSTALAHGESHRITHGIAEYILQPSSLILPWLSTLCFPLCPGFPPHRLLNVDLACRPPNQRGGQKDTAGRVCPLLDTARNAHDVVATHHQLNWVE
jgi:hypothetical protein